MKAPPKTITDRTRELVETAERIHKIACFNPTPEITHPELIRQHAARLKFLAQQVVTACRAAERRALIRQWADLKPGDTVLHYDTPKVVEEVRGSTVKLREVKDVERAREFFADLRNIRRVPDDAESSVS